MNKGKKKIRVAVLFGGRSAEHDVSLMSAKNVVTALDKNKYEPVLIGIDKQGRWYAGGESLQMLKAASTKALSGKFDRQSLAVKPGESNASLAVGQGRGEKIDVVFPVLHGTFGEDGTVQGLLKLLDVPFVGPSVLGSAVGMDKDVAKRLLRDAGIPVAKFVAIRSDEKSRINFHTIKKSLGLPLFVKPANLGSSVGISKARNELEFKKAVTLAFEYDNKILVEEFIAGREVEVAVLGNEHPKASVPGEVKPSHDFYSYEAKYLDENGAMLEIPAKLPKAVVKRLQELAVKTFQVLSCEGMSRVDFFAIKTGKIYVNEINTIPGFTKISMYPKLWEASGLSYSKLIDQLITLAIERFERDKKIKTAY